MSMQIACLDGAMSVMCYAPDMQTLPSGGWVQCSAESCATAVELGGRGPRTLATPKASLSG